MINIKFKPSKGSIILVTGIWYIIVETVINDLNETLFYCICDHANNIHCWNVKDVEVGISLKEISLLNWESSPKKDYFDKRPIPYGEIVEVVSGIHDDRFSHWDLII